MISIIDQNNRDYDFCHNRTALVQSITFTDMNDMDMAPPCVTFTMQIIDIRSGNAVNHYPGDYFADKPSNPAPFKKRLFERNGAIRSGSLQRAIITTSEWVIPCVCYPVCVLSRVCVILCVCCPVCVLSTRYARSFLIWLDEIKCKSQNIRET